MNEYKYADVEIGLTESFEKKITIDMENSFRELSGDINPLHYDDDFARKISNSKYNSHVTFGMLTASLYSTMGGVYLPGKYCLIHSIEDLSFMKPVFAGDLLYVKGTVVDKDDSLKLITVKVEIKNQDNKKVSKAKMKILLME